MYGAGDSLEGITSGTDMKGAALSGLTFDSLMILEYRVFSPSSPLPRACVREIFSL